MLSTSGGTGHGEWLESGWRVAGDWVVMVCCVFVRGGRRAWGELESVMMSDDDEISRDQFDVALVEGENDGVLSYDFVYNNLQIYKLFSATSCEHLDFDVFSLTK